jgi:hypothetical protein
MENYGTQRVLTREEVLFLHRGERDERVKKFKEFLFLLENWRRLLNTVGILHGSHDFGNRKNDLVYLIVVNKYRHHPTPPRRGHLSTVKTPKFNA